MKKCSICEIEKDESEFSFRDKTNYVKNKHCKCCQAISRERSYQKKREYYLNYSKERYPEQKIQRQKMRQFIIEYKEGKPCKDCGKIYPHYIMDFDHLPNFKKEIKIAAHGSLFSKEKLLKEFEKCELVCSNCHRERTWKRKMAASVGIPPTPV